VGSSLHLLWGWLLALPVDAGRTVSESSVVATDPVAPEDQDRVEPSSAASAKELYARALSRIPSNLAGRGLELAWVLSGMALGTAVAHTFQWSSASTVVAAVAVGALSWLGRGLSTVLIAVAVTFGGLSAVYRLAMPAFPHEEWSFRWLAPLSVVLVVLCVLLARRLGVADWRESRAAAALVDLATGGSSLLIAIVLVHRLATNVPASILLRSEDNDSWLATMAALHGPHGITAITTTVVPTYGAVVMFFFGFVRSASGGLVPGSLLPQQDGAGLIAGHMLLAVLCPLVAGLVARRTLRYGRPLLSLIAWAVPSIVLVSFSLTLSWYGFLTASLAILLFVCAAYLACIRIDLGSVRSVVVWLACALLIFAAGGAWLPLVPLAVIALFGWYMAVAVGPVLRRQWSRLRLVAVLGVPAFLLAVASYLQYHDVTSAIGGSDALLDAPGGAPDAGNVFLAGAFFAVVLGWLVNRRGADSDRSEHRAYSTPLAWIASYLIVIMLGEAWRTRTPPHYGTLKLLFVLVALAMVLGAADLMSSPRLATGSLDAVVAVAIGVLFCGTIGQGPIYGAAEAHWPLPVPQPAWTPVVDKLVAGTSRVMCIALTPTRDETMANYDAYHCSRFASSLQGREDATSLAWRYAQIGLQSPEVAAKLLKTAKDLPWTIVIIGSTDRLRSPDAWFAGLVSQPGLKFVHVKT
jgi:hypothetical protein